MQQCFYQALQEDEPISDYGWVCEDVNDPDPMPDLVQDASQPVTISSPVLVPLVPLTSAPQETVATPQPQAADPGPASNLILAHQASGSAPSPVPTPVASSGAAAIPAWYSGVTVIAGRQIPNELIVMAGLGLLFAMLSGRK